MTGIIIHQWKSQSIWSWTKAPFSLDTYSTSVLENIHLPQKRIQINMRRVAVSWFFKKSMGSWALHKIMLLMHLPSAHGILKYQLTVSRLALFKCRHFLWKTILILSNIIAIVFSSFIASIWKVMPEILCNLIHILAFRQKLTFFHT